jgi:hypothetical protein
LQKKVEISGWGLERARIQAAPLYRLPRLTARPKRLGKNLEIGDWNLKVNG